jgi:hypothetical protein
MTHIEGRPLRAALVVVVVGAAACNGRFDFDTELDASVGAEGDGEPDGLLQADDGPTESMMDVPPDLASDSDRPFAGFVECGSRPCDAVTQRCCLDTAGPHCIDAASTCAGLSIACDDPSDCASGKGCCSEERSGKVAEVHCEDATTCISKGHVLLCGNDDPSVCNGGACVPSTQSPLPPGYRECR